MKSRISDISVEDIVAPAAALFTLIISWLVILNEGVMIYGKSGRSFYLTGEEALWQAAIGFFFSAIFFFISTFAIFHLNWKLSLAIALAVLLHPTLYFIF